MPVILSTCQRTSVARPAAHVCVVLDCLDALSSLVAQSLSTIEPQQTTGVNYRATALGMVLMGSVVLGYFIASELLIGVLSNDPKVVAAGIAVPRLVAFFQVVDAATIVLGGPLNGAGGPTYTMLARLASFSAARVPIRFSVR